MIILLDNGHGFDTPGKRSPDGHFREYAYNRYLAFRIRERLQQLGLDCRLLVPEREDISLQERCRRVNKICQRFGAGQVKRKELERRVAVLEDKNELLDARCKDLFRMVLFIAKEARVLDPGLVDRSLESLGEKV